MALGTTCWDEGSKKSQCLSMATLFHQQQPGSLVRLSFDTGMPNIAINLVSVKADGPNGQAWARARPVGHNFYQDWLLWLYEVSSWIDGQSQEWPLDCGENKWIFYAAGPKSIQKIRYIKSVTVLNAESREQAIQQALGSVSTVTQTHSLQPRVDVSPIGFTSNFFFKDDPFWIRSTLQHQPTCRHSLICLLL